VSRQPLREAEIESACERLEVHYRRHYCTRMVQGSYAAVRCTARKLEQVRMHVRGYRRSAAGTLRRRATPQQLEQGGKYLAEEEKDARQALPVFVIPGWAWMWHEQDVWISRMDCMYPWSIRHQRPDTACIRGRTVQDLGQPYPASLFVCDSG
jgi:hypothetical protein